MKILLDTNVVLDVLLARQPWLGEAERIWQACEDGQLQGYLVASTLTDIFYIAQRLAGREKARQAVELCLNTFAIASIDRAILENALRLSGPDFEDNVQLSAAISLQLEAIVTRNASDFVTELVAILTPAQLLAELDKNS